MKDRFYKAQGVSRKTVPYLVEFSTSNIYGWKKRSKVIERESSCHICFTSMSVSILQKNGYEFMWISAPCRTSERFQEARSYFEYVACKKLSPWKDLLALLDYDILVDSEDRLIGIELRTFDVNRYILFHWLKAFRQCYENLNIGLFHQVYQKTEDPAELQKAFYVSSITCNTRTLFIYSGAHKLFRSKPTKEFFNRQITGDLRADKFSEGVEYSNKTMATEAFGFQGGISLDPKKYGKADLKPMRGYLFTENLNLQGTVKIDFTPQNINQIIEDAGVKLA